MPEHQRPIRLLRILFSSHIRPGELNAFRGAIAEKVGLEHDWFHNHDNRAGTATNYHYRYPLVQYKRFGRRPGILFIDRGVEEAQHFFAQPNWKVTFGRNNIKAEVTDMQVFNYQIGLSSKPQTYRLHHWLAFNKPNFEAYLRQRRLVDQLLLLEKALAGHILAFATGLDYQFERRFSVGITNLLDQKSIVLSRNKMLAFDIEFESDALLPPMVGLGRGVSRGMGETQVC